MSIDYKSTVFLPRTDFAMRGNLPEREPDLLDRWARLDLYRAQRAQSNGRERFILHDGPPYANGQLHIGHALNKILKDVINRSQQMLGKDANYVPGWDCHGLPIEWEVEKQYRKKKLNKDDVDIVEFRKECRDFAAKWIDIQREEFKRLGVIGDWDDPYTTMSYAAEAQIVREIGKFLMNGGLYIGAKPVMWSPVEKTALAEAEIEYEDHESTTIYVRFPVKKTEDPSLDGASIAIWTTTPWTIPGNRAIAFSPDISYAVYEIDAVADGSLAQAGDRLVLSTALADEVRKSVGIEDWRVVGEAAGLDRVVCQHPLHGKGYEFDVPLLAGDHVTAEQGTGFVHTAPGHGAEDFDVVQAHNARVGAGVSDLAFGAIEVPQTVGPDGCFYDHVPHFAGEHVYKVDAKVAEALADNGALLGQGKLTHSYPHSWRSKAPLIFRNTPQWFISMATNDLRDKALAAIDDTAFYPTSGQNRLHGMIESRPDWCVSRQRAWGVPITVFVNKGTGEPLRDQSVMDRIIAAVEKDGADAWFQGDPKRFLGNDHNPEDFEPVSDILDVWFDSGCTHSFVLEQREDLDWPASLYLEGSDQHRGWFHSSLLEACGTRGRAPYNGVLTHGFVLDEQGRKMSKSLGNVVAPQVVIKEYGADILRIWVVASDYSDDLRIGKGIVKHHADSYRRLRNTLRYLLGNLDGFGAEERVSVDEMPELERWVLHRLAEMDDLVRRCCDEFDFHTLFTTLHNFCAVELSAFYFDIRKDVLYCSRSDDPVRRAARTVLDDLFSCLTAWLAPIICFTAEEAWLARFPGDDQSVHLREFPEVPASWRDDDLAERWSAIREVRRVVTGCLEIERAEKRIGSSLQAAPKVFLSSKHFALVKDLDLAEIAITSNIEIVDGLAPQGAFTLDEVDGVAVLPAVAEGEKCVRCWRVLTEVGTVAGHDELCNRCADAVDHLHPRAA